MSPVKKSSKKSKRAAATTRPPRERRKDARPAEIIEAGLQEFAARGYAATRLEDVANRAGVVKGTIYRYFEDKQALFEAALRSKLPQILEPIDNLVDAFEGSTKDLVLFVLRQVYSEVVDSEMRVLLRIILSEGPQFPELAELHYRATVGRGRPFLEKIVARGVARGEIRKDHAKLLPLMIVAPTIMASVWKMSFDQFDPIDTKDFFEAHVELLVRGLFTTDGAGARVEALRTDLR